MTPAEAADRELRLVVEKLRSWAQNPPPVMEGLAPAAAFAFAAKVLEIRDHRRDGAPPDVQAVERRVDLLEWLLCMWSKRLAVSAIARELEEEEALVRDDLLALENARLVVRFARGGQELWACSSNVRPIHSAGIRALVVVDDPMPAVDRLRIAGAHQAVARASAPPSRQLAKARAR